LRRRFGIQIRPDHQVRLGAVGPRIFPYTYERLQAREQLRMGGMKTVQRNLTEAALPTSAPYG